MEQAVNSGLVRRHHRRRASLTPAVPVTLVAVLSAVFVASLANLSLWRSVLQLMPASAGSLGFLLAEAALLLALIHLLIAPFAIRPLFKPVLSLLLLISAVAAYFMDSYGSVIDKSMIQNVAETDPAEATELFSAGLLQYLALLWLLPSVILWRLRIDYGSWRRQVFSRLLSVVVSVLVIAAALASHYRDFSLIGREHKELRMQMNPVYPLYAAIRYVTETPVQPGTIQPIAEDAHRVMYAANPSRQRLVVLVVGETARAANFSLNGYSRRTNPELAQLPVYSFSNVVSCGTTTAVSVRCMFSALGRERYSQDQASAQENILDVLQRVGVNVLWRDNNSGCKGVCDRVAHEQLDKLTTPELCADGECFDGILLTDLQSRLDATTGDTLIVLHQKGSHGPAYYRRTPAAFKPFTPECQDANVQNCSQQTLINAYDNTLFYTDHVLAALTSLLTHNRDRFESTLIYLSDHGESLGEGGLYLHGFPYPVAPPEQTHVPLLVWFTPGMPDMLKLDTRCFAASTDTALSHDHLFHSLLGLFDVRTNVYEQELDLFSDCRQPNRLAPRPELAGSPERGLATE
ncbi:MAG TPA: phosphoethanolamine--lipid A transferase [Permianibacter sp.]|nr:phosphoethanolamine--lipid A transferase [Permianibacter sp.]